MIDIHTHILPGVDDGAEDFIDALLMADLAAESGVHTIIATPHSNLPGMMASVSIQEFWRVFHELQGKLAERQHPLTLLSGMEIFATEDVAEKITGRELLSLNDTEYYLLEFDIRWSGRHITSLLEEVCKVGVIPVIAHPERYDCIQKNPEAVSDWLDMGCQIQVNKGSIFGSFGKRAFETAHWLLKNECVTYVASDAHSPYRRTTYMRDAFELIKEEFSRSMAQRLLVENPEYYLRRTL